MAPESLLCLKSNWIRGIKKMDLLENKNSVYYRPETNLNVRRETVIIPLQKFVINSINTIWSKQ
jgi:hypothetical protein